MNPLLRLSLLFLPLLVLVSTIARGQLVVSGPYTIVGDTTVSSITVTSTGVLTANGLVTVTGNVTIQSGGVVTHAPRLLAGLRLNVSGTLDVQAGGLIDVTGKGLRGGNDGSAFGLQGETFGANDSIVAGSAAGPRGVSAGGSYGGRGANGTRDGVPDGRPNEPYGVLEDPRHLGSGGSATGFGEPGGNGGGRVRILAGSCIVNGSIVANGTSRLANAAMSGGSGGAVRLDVGSLSGAGQIQALGAAGVISGPAFGGSGGGGRIAVYYGLSAFPVSSILAQSGNSGDIGSPGTIYLKDSTQANGSVIIDNGPFATTLTTPFSNAIGIYQNIVVGAGSTLSSTSNLRVTNQAVVRTRANLRAQDTLFIQRADSAALTGGGKIVAGTIQRAIAANQLVKYRFETDSTYVRYRVAAIFPSAIYMTSYPDTNPATFSSAWLERPSSIDTLTNTIRIESAKPKGKWAIGIPRLGPAGGSTSVIDFVRRVYALSAKGDTSAFAVISFRYEQSEVPATVQENSLRLFYIDSTVTPPNAISEPEELPREFALFQNYPNPFNPTTTFRYALPVESHVTLKIYNILGQEIRTLVDEVQSAGFVSVVWDGKNNRGDDVASSVYVYRLEASNTQMSSTFFAQSRKTIVAK